MGMTLVCDGCGADVQYIERLQIQYASIETGTIQADLCPVCAAPFWRLPVGKQLKEQAEQEMVAEEARRREQEARMAEENARKVLFNEE